MDFISVLASIILFTTIATLIVALAAYGAYKIRESRRPKPGRAALRAGGEFEAIFLERYVPLTRSGQEAS
ncbi:MAG TPA: hypothetical protein VF816_15715 [Rhodocyclaceae bacterium]